MALQQCSATRTGAWLQKRVESQFSRGKSLVIEWPGPFIDVLSYLVPLVEIREELRGVVSVLKNQV